MTTIRYTLVLIVVSVGMYWSNAIRAEVGDPTLRTDHPQYAGEGAFQTVEDCAEFATSSAKSPQDRALAMYNWLLSHQWHLLSPQEPLLPGKLPDTKQAENYELMVFDANRARFSYGYGLCGTVHAWNEPYWKALGMNARRRAFPGHTNSEIEYGGTWHTFDTDMAGLIFRRDGVVAGYEDIVADPSLIGNARPPIPCYPFDWPNDFRTMQRGWQEVAKGGNWYKMYHSGYAAHPGIVHLRSGETFTRYFDRDHFGGQSKRQFWHHEHGGPFRNWSFAFQGEPQHRGKESNSRSQVSYANGEFIYRPDLTSQSSREGLVHASSNLSHSPSSPLLRSRDRQPASCTFHHFSPYVICGDPVDDANPMSGRATEGFIIAGQTAGSVKWELSVDQGQSWQSAGEVNNKFALDLTDHVKGRYGWYVRLSWSGDGGIDELSFRTVTQVCQTIYPCLKPNGSRVIYQCASRAVAPLLPNFGLTEASLADCEVKKLRSSNVRYSPRSEKSRYAYQTTNNKPGDVVFRIAAPAELIEVAAAARFGIRVPSPPNCNFRLETSTDDGRTWSTLGQAEIPADNEYSSGWMYGRSSLQDKSASSVLLRVHLDAGGYSTGLMETQAYGVYRTQPPQKLALTYGWKEKGQQKTHREAIPAGTMQHSFHIPTGEQITDDFVRLECVP